MKKTLLSIFGALLVSSAIGQASASWSLTQNAAWPKVSTGVRLLSAVDANVVWAHGYDGTTGNTSRNYSWFTRTINGGTSFASGNIYTSTLTPLIGDTNSYKIAGLEGVDANTCWVVSYLKAGQNKGAIHRTTNGGTTWQNMTAPGMFTNTASFANIVHFLTPLIGITMGDPHPGIGNEYEIWRTTDGGNTWSLIPGANIPNPSSANEFGLTGVSTKLGSNNIWFGTNEGRIFRSTDAGLTWNVSTLNAISSVNEIAFSTPNNGYAWIYANNTTLETYTTTNGGATWSMIPTIDPNLGLNNMGAIPGTANYASAGAGATNNIISYSQNAGVNWIDWGSIGVQYLTVDFVNNTTGWAGGFSDATNVGIGGIYKYTGPAITTAVPPTAAFSAPPVLCLSTGTAALVNSSTGNPTPTYTWTSSPAAVFSSSTAAAPTITFATAGTYTISLLAANSGGTNVATQVVLVQACSSPTAGFTGASTACTKISYTVVNTTTAAPAATYNWTTTPSAGVVISNSTAAAPSFSFNNAGVYAIGLLATNASGSNTAVNSVTVNVCSPTASFSLPAITCNTAAITATNSSTPASFTATINYTWSAVPGGTACSISNVTAPQPQFTFNVSGNYTVTLIAGNASGVSTATQVVSFCTSLQENSNVLNSISVFPNPSSGVFSIANSLSNDNVNFSVTNILGSVISSGKFNNSKNIDLSSQAKGIYFITFESNGSKMTKKIILE